MKIFSSTLFCIALMFGSSVTAQQWLDKNYDFEIFPDSVYGYSTNFYGGTDTLKMDIYSPICDDSLHTSRRPLMIWIHGGAFLVGDKSDNSIVNLCKEFAKRGYVTASIDYRLGFVSDHNSHACNFPNYECEFAADSAEWARAYYRSVQDAKGAIRYLINRNVDFRIDTNNVFVAGESAGAFAALGAALMDDETERPIQSFATSDVPIPGNYSLNCFYNEDAVFLGETVSRPDLGSIQGNIEPSTIQYTIKGIGNMFGGMYSDLLEINNAAQKPAIYSFHQRCDLVVPIDSGFVVQGVSWCLSNGYNCYPFMNNNVMLYGSRAIRDWNENNNYGYTIANEFASVDFPYNFWFGQGSCVDQGLNLGCHGYSNKPLQEKNLAEFFAPLITTSPICDTAIVSSVNDIATIDFEIFPNPVKNQLNFKSNYNGSLKMRIFNPMGKVVLETEFSFNGFAQIDLNKLPNGIYFMELRTNMGVKVFKILKE